MNLVDANILVYAVNDDARHHEAARTGLDGSLPGTETVGFAWIALLAFVRLTTKVGLSPQPLPVEHAMDRVDAWLGAGPAVVVEPRRRHPAIMRELAAPAATS